jgi:tagatose 6-phosphate kinase
MTFDRVVIDDVNRARETRDYASGKSINVARVIHTMGHPVLATGFVGGTSGRKLCGDLDAAGIPHDFVMIHAETRKCITVIDHSNGTATELVEESTPVPDTSWKQLNDRLVTLLPKAGTWVFSGTLPPAAPQDFYARWLPLAAQTHALAIIDAKGEPLKQALKFGNAIFKLNRDEFAQTLGADLGDESRLIEAIRKQTPPGGTLIITLGARGAIGSDSRSCWRVISPKVKAISAVGSGDAFSAGIALGLSSDQSLPASLQLAAACGAANALTPLAGHLDPHEVGRLLAEARVDAV